MDSLKTAKVIAVATAILFGISLSWLLATRKHISTLQTELDRERLHSESLLSQKLLAEKSMTETQDQLRITEDSLSRVMQLCQTKSSQLFGLHKTLSAAHQQLASERLAKKNLEEQLLQLRETRSRQRQVSTRPEPAKPQAQHQTQTDLATAP